MAIDTRIALLVGVTSLVSCVLVVPAARDDLGATCGLTDDELGYDCGTCMAAHCQDELNACCAAGDACEPAIDPLVTCTDYGHTCSPIGTSDAESELRACIARECATGACEVDPNEVFDAGADATAGSKVCTENGEVCGCTVLDRAEAAADGTCGPQTIRENWVCCSTASYPAVASTCACYPVQCVQYESSCECGAYGAHGDGSEYSTVCSTSDGTCCKTATGCDCDETRARCPADTTEVTICSDDDVHCQAGDKELESCN